MGSLERGFEKALELHPGEAIRWSAAGMYRVGRSWVGGRIYVSDQRLFFCPGVLVRRRYGILRVALPEIASVDRVGRRLALGSIADGALKPHLRVSTVSGETYALTMQRFDKHAGELEALLSGVGA